MKEQPLPTGGITKLLKKYRKQNTRKILKHISKKSKKTIKMISDTDSNKETKSETDKFNRIRVLRKSKKYPTEQVIVV